MDLQRAPYIDVHAHEVDRVQLHCFPSADAVFAAHVGDLLQQLDRSALSAGVLESKVRLIYPATRVHVRDPLANIGPAQTTWYVFRDGRP